MNFYGVIGANYGDEGKGLTIDWLCRTFNPYRVVRFNGGAQAGHTVQASDGQRHVFSTFGSGTLAGVATELTRDVVINPYAALMERDRLIRTHKVPQAALKVYFDYRSPITTPFEVAINQELEKLRGEGRHGSCGLGINETVERHKAMLREENGRRLCDALYEPSAAHEAFDWIKNVWVVQRMWSLGFNEEDIKLLQAKTQSYLSAYISCIRQAEPMIFSPIEENHLHVVYEGAQGLALDEEMGAFPHVTRSNTGMKNILLDLQRRLVGSPVENDRHTLHLLFPTRTYLTRHGAGPLEYEDHAVNVLCGKRHADETNFTNPWQGSLRYAPLNVAATCARIKADYVRNKAFLEHALPNLTISLQAVLTCCDEAERVRVVDNDMRPTSWESIMNLFGDHGIPVALTSHGPSAKTVQVHSDHFMVNPGFRRKAYS